MTRLAGVIGDPVGHSLSPILHNAAYSALGLDISYSAFRVSSDELGEAVLGARALGFVGLSVTTPHKQRVVEICDEISPLVEQIGAANTILFDSGLTFAESTDGAGLVDDLVKNAHFEPSGRRCAVLGAGGAARAVVVALVTSGAKSVLVVNRTHAAAKSAVESAGGVSRVGAREELSSAELIVNATSVAFDRSLSDSEGKEIAASLASGLHEGQLAYDLQYSPPLSPFLLEAARRGATTRSGLGMLVHQAAHQVEIFTNQPAPLPVMWDAVEPHRGSDPLNLPS